MIPFLPGFLPGLGAYGLAGLGVGGAVLTAALGLLGLFTQPRWLRLWPSEGEGRVIDYPRYRSAAMNKDFHVEVWLPLGRNKGQCRDCWLLVTNDGQDMRTAGLRATLDSLTASRQIPSVVVVAVHAKSRMQDYGLSTGPDYAGRGGLAAAYARFIARELTPQMIREYGTLPGPAHTAVMGFSLGGLSALDIAWHHPRTFGAVGVFSGSLWWRGKSYTDGYTDADRLAHQLVTKSPTLPPVRVYLQTGTLDETNDRDGDGVIDSMGDARDLATALEHRGLKRGTQGLTLVEIEGGQHNPQTWGLALPDFLRWWTMGAAPHLHRVPELDRAHTEAR